MSRAKSCGNVIAALLANSMLGKSQLAGVAPTPRTFLPCPKQLFNTYRCCCHAAPAPAALAPPAPCATANQGGETQTSEELQLAAPSGVKVRSRRQEVPSRQQSKTDLRQVPGIGPKYEQLLLAKRVGSVESLREVFIKQADRKEQQMISYLQVQAFAATPAPPSRLACMPSSHAPSATCLCRPAPFRSLIRQLIDTSLWFGRTTSASGTGGTAS